MDFGFSSEEDQQQMSKGKLPFSYSSSNSSPNSSSSSQHKTQQLASLSLTNSRWEQQQIYHQMSPNWLGSRYEPAEEEDNEPPITAADNSDSASLELRSSSVSRNNNNNSIEKEHMFDKVVTPSDVGKLNRLVIPKQHAEKYFPLDSTANEKGLLLNFEDRNGKPWRFRYSYWNSSQSYVMTKGWSRFVKDKKLDAGDIVSFQRGVGELGKDRLFIDWRRRPDAVILPDQVSFHNPHYQHQYYSAAHRSVPWSPLLMRPPSHINRNNISYYGSTGYPSGSNVVNPGGSVFYLRSAAAAPPMMEWQRQHHQGGGGGVVEPIVFDSVPVVQGKAAAKRLRLFGVNMDCPIPDQSSSDDCEMMLSTNPATMAIASSQPPLQLRLYNGTPLVPPTHDFLNANKGKASSLSFDLDLDM